MSARAGAGRLRRRAARRRPSRPPRRRRKMRLRWPAPADPMKLAEQAGLTPETHEFLLFHVHAHLDVFVNGRPCTVPAGIGIDIDNPGVHSAQQRRLDRVRLHRPALRAALHLSAAHSRLSRTPAHRGQENQFNKLGEFFTRVERPARPEVRRRLLQAGGPDHDLRRRRCPHRQSTADRAREHAGDRDRDRHASGLDSPRAFPSG